MMDTDLRDLLAAWLGGDELSAERQEALLARLRADEAFRHAFVDEIHLLGMLKAVQSAPPRWLRLEDELGWSAREPLAAASLVDRVLHQARAQARLRTFSRRLLAAAALVAAVTGVAVLLRSFRSTDVVNEPPPSPHVDFARVAKLDGVRWESEAGAHPEEGHAVPPGRLGLLSGRLTLAFLSGVRLTVEGPAELELINLDRVYCYRGKLRVRVPAGAEGFTVAAPGYEVVDLGTEFGLNQDPKGMAQLMVFEGQVAVSVLGEDGSTVQSALLEGPDAVEVDAQSLRIRQTPPRPEYFIASPEPTPQSLKLDRAYRAEVLRSRPWGYWRFETMPNWRVPNEVAERPSLQVRGGVQLANVPGGGPCALFSPGDPDQSFVMDGLWAPARGKGYAIELWVQAESLGQTALVSLIAQMPGPDENHVSLLELSARSRQAEHAPCAVRFLDRWPPGLSGGENVFSRRTYIPDRWHHVVGQRTSDTLEVYIDGALMGTSRADRTSQTTRCQLLVGRLKQLPLRRSPSEIRAFEGRLSELAVYERPLTVVEIRRHYQYGAGLVAPEGPPPPAAPRGLPPLPAAGR